MFESGKINAGRGIDQFWTTLDWYRGQTKC